MKSYRDLEVFKQSKQLAIEVHKMTLTLPTFEMFEEGSQTRRSAKAVASLIVEGYGRRRYKADFIKYWCMLSLSAMKLLFILIFYWKPVHCKTKFFTK